MHIQVVVQRKPPEYIIAVHFLVAKFQENVSFVVQDKFAESCAEGQIS